MVRLVQIKSGDLEFIAEFCSSSVDCMRKINEVKWYQEEPFKLDNIDVGETTLREVEV